MLQKYNLYVPDEVSGRAAPRVPTETYHYDQYSRQVYKIKNYNDNSYNGNNTWIITETISGSMPTARRKGFVSLLDKIERNDPLSRYQNKI